jgi:hypothetical protein
MLLNRTRRRMTEEERNGNRFLQMAQLINLVKQAYLY